VDIYEATRRAASMIIHEVIEMARCFVHDCDKLATATGEHRIFAYLYIRTEHKERDPKFLGIRLTYQPVLRLPDRDKDSQNLDQWLRWKLPHKIRADVQGQCGTRDTGVPLYPPSDSARRVSRADGVAVRIWCAGNRSADADYRRGGDVSEDFGTRRRSCWRSTAIAMPNICARPIASCPMSGNDPAYRPVLVLTPGPTLQL
jgi:hypothetical protein